MNMIGNILPVSHVLLDLEVTSKKRLFEQVGLLLENEAGLVRAEVFDCLFAREKLGTTGMGYGVAIPHGRHASVKKAVGVFVRMKEPIAFDAPDGKPVSLAVVLLVPENATNEYLEVLSLLASKLSDKNVREALLQAPTAEEVHHLLTKEI